MMRITKVFSFISFFAVSIMFVASSFAGSDILIKPAELADIIGTPGVVIVDARGEKSYKKRHLPGAVNLPADLLISLRDEDKEKTIKKLAVPFPVEKAEKIFGGFGISNNSIIVVYDSPPDVSASYVRFTLKVYGVENVRILAGGIKAWRKEKRPLTDEVAKINPAVFKTNLRTETLINADWILKNKESIQLFDTRSLQEFVGVRSAGHIPGALRLDWIQLAGAKESFKSAEEINEIINKTGISKDKEIVIYCVIGPRASFVFAAFEMVGYKPKFYWGSLRDWQADPDRPIAKK